MGKYMRKSKPAGDVAVMEVSSSSHGVRTRAKTLALQQHSTSSYLQLRSRRLEKPPFLLQQPNTTRRTRPPKPTHSPPIVDMPNPKPKPKSSSAAVTSPSNQKGAEAAEEPVAAPTKEEEEVVKNNNELVMLLRENKDDEFGVGEASFGEENVLEFEPRERTTRESTPCSLIRDPDTIGTPGSTTRPTNSANANGRIRNSSLRHIPTAHDMDEFFTGAEEDQQKQFIDKYNFDPVNDKPLPGRYKWEKLDP